tara:strand:+ start:2723 stop:3505 length:783 start_codon:yes stop_codon:yes gene_type:complete
VRILFLLIFVLFSLNVSAESYGNAVRYDVTIKQIDICENATITNETNFTTSGCVTLGSNDFTADIASKSVGATFGKYTDTTGMIQGRTYRYFVPTLSRSFTITGSVTFTKLSDGNPAVCNTDEDASIGSNARHLTISTGKVGGTATPMTAYVPSATTSGIHCRNQDCSDSTGGQTFIHDIPNTKSLYGSAIDVPADGTGTMSMVYELSSPFTVGETVPVITMKFGTKNALETHPFRDNAGNDTCSINAYFPKFSVSVINP